MVKSEDFTMTLKNLGVHATPCSIYCRPWPLKSEAF